MEQGGDVVVADQRGLAGRGLGEVADVVDHRPGPEQLGLTDEVAHPGAAVFAVALEEIEIDQADGRAILVEHFIDADVGVIDRQVRSPPEGDAVEPLGDVEEPVVQHTAQLEIGLQLLLVQVVLLLAQPLGVPLPIPRLQLDVLALAGDQGLQLLGLGPDRRRRGPRQPVQEGLHRLRRRGHLVLQGIGGEALVPEQPRLLRSQGCDFQHHRARVVVVAQLGPLPAALEQGFAHSPVLELGEGRLLGRVGQRQDPFPPEPPRLCVRGGGGDLLGAQAGQLRRVLHHEGSGLGAREQLLLDSGLKH